MSDFPFQAAHFRPPETADERRRLFAESVTNVVVEITRYCNRQCAYCPVSGVDRVSGREALPAPTYARIIDDLAQIRYAGSLCLNLYNEPTADRPLLLERIREARARLPGCRIYFSTNGDFLNAEYVKAMVEAGLSEMYVTLHMPAGRPYDDAYAVSRFTELSKRLGKAIRVDVVSTGHTVQGHMNLSGIPINVFSTNYDVYGSDRAGSVKGLTHARFQRNSPCARPFRDFTVSWDGTIFPCCQMFVDNEEHRRNYAIGRIEDFPDIFAAYASAAMAGWRRDLLRFSPKKRPCDTCNEDCREPAAGEAQMRDEIHRRYVGPIEDEAPAAAPRRPIFLRWLSGGGRK